jgi:hypothetical protein
LVLNTFVSHNPSQVPAHEDASFLETIDTTEPPAHYSSKHGEANASEELALTPFIAAYQGSDRNFVHSLVGTSPDKASTSSRAIVPVLLWIPIQVL